MPPPAPVAEPGRNSNIIEIENGTRKRDTNRTVTYKQLINLKHAEDSKGHSNQSSNRTTNYARIQRVVFFFSQVEDDIVPARDSAYRDK